MKKIVLAMAVAASATPLFAAQPAAVAAALYEAYAEGNPAHFRQLWADGVAPARLAEVDTPSRCLVPLGFTNVETTVEADRAEVRLVAVMSRVSRPAGRFSYEVEHATVGLRRAGDQWRVERWTLAEDDLAERVVTAPNDNDARALVSRNVDLLDAAFYRDLRKRSTDLINRRQFAALQRLTSAMCEFAGLTGDDGAFSTAFSLDSIADRLAAPPDLIKAEVDTQSAIAAAERSGDPDVIASALLNRARLIQWRDGNASAGVPLFERVLSMRSRIDDAGLVSRAAIQMAAWHRGRGDYRGAFPFIRIAQEIAEGLHNTTSLYEVELVLSDIYLSENDVELGIAHVIRARELAQAMHYEMGFIGMSAELARCYQRLGRRREFRKTADETLARVSGSESAFNQFVAKLRQAVALDDLAQGHLAEADRSIEKAIQDSNKLEDDDVAADVYDTLARVRLAQHRYGDVIAAAGEGIRLRAKQKAVTRETPWFLAAQAHLALGDRAAAYAALRSAVDYGEQERAGIAGSERQLELSFEPTAAAYGLLVDMLVEDHRDEEAFFVAEKAKARTLLDVLASERSSIEEEIPSAELAEQQRLEQNLVEANRLGAGVEKARVELESYRTLMEARHPRLHATRGAARLTSLQSLAPLLSRRNVIVEYVAGAERLHLFILRRGQHGRIRLTVRTVAIGRGELVRAVDPLASALASRDAFYREKARRLYDLALAPAMTVAGGASLVTVIPDGALWRVPFEALIDADQRFAVERRAFSYAPSVAILLAQPLRPEARLAGANGRRFLGFGNPRLAANDTPVPEAEHEVQRIARFFGAKNSRVYVGKEALESRCKHQAPRYDVIHFATHGVIDDANPMYSRLILARQENDGEDGALEAREMMAMHLSADLVVLSACDTARGDVHAGEGLIGMTWALFAAGCPSVVASDWRVGSATTEVLMESFYRNWLTARAAAQPFAKAEALRRARLSLLRDPRWRHPYYWAPFVLVGRAE
jgi:CHAT domain-containing protein